MINLVLMDRQVTLGDGNGATSWSQIPFKPHHPVDKYPLTHLIM